MTKKRRILWLEDDEWDRIGHRATKVGISRSALVGLTFGALTDPAVIDVTFRPAAQPTEPTPSVSVPEPSPYRSTKAGQARRDEILRKINKSRDERR